MGKFLSRFFYVTQGRHRSLLGLLFIFLLISFLELIGVGLVGPFISIATNPALIRSNYWLSSLYGLMHFNSDQQFLLAFGSFVILIFYGKSFISFCSQKLVFEFGFSLQAELMCKLLNSYLTAPYVFHLNRNSSSIIQNIINETQEFCTGLVMPLLTSLSNGVIILMLTFLLLKTDVMAVLIIVGILVIAVTIFYLMKDRLATWGREYSEAHTEMIRLINHSLGGFKETKVIGCEAYFENQMQAAADKYKRSAGKALGFSNLPRYIIEAFFITFLICFTILFVILNEGNEGNLTSVLGIFALASIRLLPAVGNLVSAVNGMKYKSYSLDKIYLDLNEISYLNQDTQNRLDYAAFRPEPYPSFSFNKTITLDQVTYRYPGASREALDSISLSLKKGESIGIIGKSGSGKTTLIDVILGLLKPQQGTILADGQSIYADLRRWQNVVGYVPQTIFLTDDSLERNIAFGVPDHLIDQEQLHKAIVAAQLEGLVKDLPEGIHTRVGERGVLLSGGQRQRVGIARALYHKREILIFDEATAALDNETEALVTDAIRALSGIKTMVIIAHRLSTIEHCDRIYQLQEGKIIRSGTYDEVVLSEKCSR